MVDILREEISLQLQTVLGHKECIVRRDTVNSIRASTPNLITGKRTGWSLGVLSIVRQPPALVLELEAARMLLLRCMVTHNDYRCKILAHRNYILP